MESRLDFVRNRISELRVWKDVSEYTMSLDLGHCRGYIQGISSGRAMPSMKEFFTICDYLGITPRDFFDPMVRPYAPVVEMTDYLIRLPEEDVEYLLTSARFLIEKHKNKEAGRP